MNNKNQKLELTWIGKDEQPKLEPRILIEDPEKSYGHTPRPSQEGNKHTPNPLSRGEYKSPLLGGDLGVGELLQIMLTNDLVRCKLFLIAILITTRYFTKHKIFALWI